MGVEVVDVRALAGSGAQREVLWSAESALQTNVVRLAPGARIDVHAELQLDVVLSLLVGSLALTLDDGMRTAEAPAVVVLPAGTRRALEAGADGATYLTVHRRRDGLMPTVR